MQTAAVNDWEIPDKGSPISEPVLPAWIRKWAKAEQTVGSSADDYGELIQLVGEEETLRAILSDPAIVRGLERELQALQQRGCNDAEGRIFQVLAFACFGHSVATKTEFLSKSDIAGELKAIVKSARKVAKKIRALSPNFPAADTLGYLVERLQAVPGSTQSAVYRRAGLRAGRYSVRIGSSPSVAPAAPLTLSDLLKAFAADLEDQLACRPRSNSSRTKTAGVHAARNYQIDLLIRHTNAAFGNVPFALVAAIVSAANGISVHESVVRKRPVLRKIRPEKS